MNDSLRPLWDFDDLDGSEQRFRDRLDSEPSAQRRAEILTQLARVAGLRGDFTSGDELLDEAAALGGTTPIVTARVDLERGRLRRSGGERDAARPLFESAYAVALGADFHDIAADAAHMVALVAPDRDAFVEWTNRGIELAEGHEAASWWLSPLLNNLGWEQFEADELDAALATFERALAVREREPDKPGPIEIARYAVGKTLRRLGRSEEAIPLLEQAVAWAEGADVPDGWFHEELAEEYDAVGRAADACRQALLAIPLLERDDPSFTREAERAARLASLASG
jgi:tetratricopeptide (TPR) repeat protein